MAHKRGRSADSTDAWTGRTREDRSEWQRTLQQAIKAIVSIRFSQVSAFDTEPPVTSEATGFVVDKERGIILTNRHGISGNTVTCAGPFVGDAVWHDHEEAEVLPVYRDPVFDLTKVHDFGFLRFDPKSLKYMELHEIELAPHAAKVGIDIRVVGNDAGEKLSILAGSISRLDRNAPDYGELTYNDFNTFYLQAASSTSGGSSGSPVLDIHGRAVALQAGGHTKAATDFFFPLDRVKRALKYIQRNESVPRGTIQTQFVHRPFDEVRRLGLPDVTEALIREFDPSEIGMLCAETVVPQGPASAFLEESDILISINGMVITKFVPLEDCLDSNVGKQCTFTVCRGGQQLSFTIPVQDLHSITPDRYLELGGAKLNNLSYQLAVQFCLPVKGVYVSEPAGSFRLDGSTDNGWLIESVDAKLTPDLDSFIAAVRNIPDRERIPVTYYSIADAHNKSVAIINIERHWSSFRLAVRNDKSGYWDFHDLGKPIPPKISKPMNADFPEMDPSLGPAQAILHSLAKVTMIVPLKIEGFPKSKKHGAGLVIDAELGLIIVSRSIVPYALGDILITFADSITVPGKVQFLHPTQNIAIVKYDPVLIGTTPVKSAPISTLPLVQGHKVTLVAFNHNNRPVCINTTVTDVASVVIPINATPRFRAINFEAVTLDTPIAQQCSSGVLTDPTGCVQGLWLSYLGEKTPSGHDNEYYLGIDIRKILHTILPPLRAGQELKLRGIAAEFSAIQMSQCRNMGLSDEWVRKVEIGNPKKRQLLLVRRTEAGSPTASALKDLDVVLSVNKTLVTNISDLDVSPDWDDTVRMHILRDKKEMDLVVPISEMDGDTTKHLVIWSGAIFHEPHNAVRQQSRLIPSLVYVSSRSKGSPAYTHGISPTQWITHVNGSAVRTLTDFADGVRDLPDKSYARIKTISFDLVPCVISVKVNNHYWPMTEMVRDVNEECGWRVINSRR